MRQSESYEDKLRDGLLAYLRVTGRSVDPTMVDPARPEVRAAYDAFRRAPLRIGLGSNDAEWAALALGLKPMVREVLPPDRWRQVRAEHEAQGYQTLVLTTAVSEEPWEGYTFDRARANDDEQGGDAPWIRRVSTGTAGDDRVIVYVGHDPDSLQEACDIDAAFIEQRAGDQESELVARMGELLGYPPCCTAAYSEQTRVYSNRQPIGASLERTAAPRALLNNLSLGIFHYIAYFPCSYDCRASLAYATRLDQHYAREARADRDRALRVLAMPRIYIDDRRQVLLDGHVRPDGTVRYTGAYSPFTFDRARETAAFDWIFWMDVVEQARAADTVVPTDGAFQLEKEGRLVGSLPRDGALWFPFRP